MLNFCPSMFRKCVANILAHVPFSELCHKTNHNFLLVSPIELISSPLFQFLSDILWDIKHCDVCFGDGDNSDDQNCRNG